MDLELNNITKRYGDVTALDSISLKIPKTATVGVIGHNGSGKTTLLEILCGLNSFDQGTINISIDRKYKERLGVILQNSSFYDDARVNELIDLFASFYKQHVDLEFVKKQTGINKYEKKLYRSLSGGMKQKVNIALALLNDPKVLILDEPTTGLDPLAREELWEIIKNFTQKSLILVSSHYMDEIEKNCDFIIFLKDGKVVDCGDLKTILERENTSLEEYYLKVNKGGNVS